VKLCLNRICLGVYSGICESFAATPIDIDSNYLLYPAPLSLFHFCPKCNRLISW